MFEMSYRNQDGALVRGGMAFDAKEHVPIFASKSGSLITEQDWPGLRHALDAALPESELGEFEKAHERMGKFRVELEKLLEKWIWTREFAAKS
jgi:hypothetical protein